MSHESNINGSIADIYGALVGNLYTIQAHYDTETNLTNEANGLQGNFLDRQPTSVEADYATDPMGAPLAALLAENSGSDSSTTKFGAIQTFMTDYMTSTDITNDWSTQGITSVESALNNCYDPNTGPPVMGTLTGYSSIISSESTKELTPLQALVKSEGSVIQQDASAQQPLSDAGTAFVSLLKVASTALQSTYL